MAGARDRFDLLLTCCPEAGPFGAGEFQLTIAGRFDGAGDEAKQVFRGARLAFVLKQAEDGTPIAEVCRKTGVSEATFYAWRKKYAGLMPFEMKRLRQLEEENAKLKRLVADLSLDKAMLQDVVSRKL
jgi:putative transposase